jgi:hypothetical protein
MVLRSLVAIAAATNLAHADGALDELSVGNTQQTATTPQAMWLADKLAGFWDANEHWQLRADLTGTRMYTRTLTSTGLGEPADVLLASPSLEYDPNECWSIRGVASWSPSSPFASSASFPMRTAAGTTMPAQAALDGQSGSKGGALWLGYDSTDRVFPISFTSDITATQFQMQQQITSAIDAAGNNLTIADLDAYCAANSCTRELQSTLHKHHSSLTQIVVDGNVSQTLWKDTEIGLDAAYYAYTKDPTKVGYFASGALGRTTTSGAGMGIAPYELTVMPDLIHRFGQLMVMSSLSYGRYVDAEGYDLTATVRLQYKLKLTGARRLKLWTKLTGSRDIDATNATSHTTSAAVGAQYVW